ncbi:hypothetical protein PMNALOAF_1268 [Methylobacterium adhaesivum]|uniref:Cyanophage baseplate Pam3 plug gp18 domain-containing protein n=1 Tax=Methylobacterium adhaesivum TaxID=333297 RepID=A0ABT8BHD3_9HYPH|nr:hypothetical protein [Methylobacterium adhaesivum]MDN3590589.1 hypothetical protein [Methylobacterium adhaesivum]GJD30025.1 hypothetical protein PMNALOAF_1268 [Methylobacterium adhaesivum]
MREFIISDAPDQEFTTIITGLRCAFRFRYNPTSDRWSFDLRIGDEPRLAGRRIVLETDLLGPFRLGIGAIVALDVEGRGNVPDRRTLPARKVRLYHLEPEEVAEVRALP